MMVVNRTLETANRTYFINEGHDRSCFAYLVPAIGSQWGEDSSDKWLITSIRASYAGRGKGLGTRVLQAIVEDADKEGCVLLLGVYPENPARFERLIMWYKRFGFEPYSGRRTTRISNMMIRNPS